MLPGKKRLKTRCNTDPTLLGATRIEKFLFFRSSPFSHSYLGRKCRCRCKPFISNSSWQLGKQVGAIEQLWEDLWLVTSSEWHSCVSEADMNLLKTPLTTPDLYLPSIQNSTAFSTCKGLQLKYWHRKTLLDSLPQIPLTPPRASLKTPRLSLILLKLLLNSFLWSCETDALTSPLGSLEPSCSKMIKYWHLERT